MELAKDRTVEKRNISNANGCTRLSAENKNINRNTDSVSPLWRLWEEREETISHVVAECKMYTQKQYCLWSMVTK